MKNDDRAQSWTPPPQSIEHNLASLPTPERLKYTSQQQVISSLAERTAVDPLNTTGTSSTGTASPNSAAARPKPMLDSSNFVNALPSGAPADWAGHGHHHFHHHHHHHHHHQHRQQQTFNPYANNVYAYSLPSPGTQFYAGYSPQVAASMSPQHHAAMALHHQQMYQVAAAAAGYDPAAAAAMHHHHHYHNHSHHHQHHQQQMAHHTAMVNPYTGMYGGKEVMVGYGRHPMLQAPMNLQVSVGARGASAGGAGGTGGGPMHLPDPILMQGGAPGDVHMPPLSVGFTPYVAPYQMHASAAPYGAMAPYGRQDGGGMMPEAGGYGGGYGGGGGGGGGNYQQGGGGNYQQGGGGGGYGGYAMERNAGRGGGGGGGFEGGRGGPRRERGGGRGGRGGRGGGGYHGGAPMPQSEFVQSFRANNGAAKWRLVDIAGHAAEFARDQEGSRFIQAQLDIASPDEVNDLFHEIFERPAELITDVFGNYVLQKMLEMATSDQLLFVATSLSGHVVHLTLQTYGCRVIQKCIEVMPVEAQNIIIAELEGNVAKCIQDQNGNHVIQKCVEVVPERCGFIVNAFAGRVKELATHAYGCRVIQCILQQCPMHEPAIFAELLQCIEELTLDQYGNYVVQHVLAHAKPGQMDAIAPYLIPHFYKFSTHKFASNVMEKFFASLSEAQRAAVVAQLTAELTHLPREDCGPEFGQLHPASLYLMMKDQFGNYVVQQVIDMSSEALKKEMMQCAQKYVFALRRHPYGKHMVARLERAKLLVPPQAQASGMTPQPSDASTVEGLPS